MRRSTMRTRGDNEGASSAKTDPVIAAMYDGPESHDLVVAREIKREHF
jgi:hypothetical protein